MMCGLPVQLARALRGSHTEDWQACSAATQDPLRTRVTKTAHFVKRCSSRDGQTHDRWWPHRACAERKRQGTRRAESARPNAMPTRFCRARAKSNAGKCCWTQVGAQVTGWLPCGGLRPHPCPEEVAHVGMARVGSRPSAVWRDHARAILPYIDSAEETAKSRAKGTRVWPNLIETGRGLVEIAPKSVEVPNIGRIGPRPEFSQEIG